MVSDLSSAASSDVPGIGRGKVRHIPMLATLARPAVSRYV
jgi:hypothetical protein